MSNITDALTAEFEALKKELIAKHDALGMRASGNWANSLAVKVTENRARIMGADYGNEPEPGRKPGTAPPSKAMEKRVKDDGIATQVSDEMNTGSLAFLIAKKAAGKGNDKKQHNAEEVVSSVVTPKRIQQIIDKVSPFYTDNFCKEIINYLKSAAI